MATSTTRTCDVVGCGVAYTDESMAYCNECSRDFCEYHADLLLKEYGKYEYMCDDCKTALWEKNAPERRRVDYLRTIDPAKATTVVEYKRQFVILSQNKKEAKKQYELFKDAQATLEQAHGPASGHVWLMMKHVSIASKAYDRAISLFREYIDMVILQWANGPYQDRIDEIARWRREEGKHFE